ncbi:Calx-beta domain-containing protein [Candidatus Halobeggiatoa sp. HSG11]|nr:Calx-beta domain-containing protein [Candidatus Halobeggiatoa sp. HSG11]
MKYFTLSILGLIISLLSTPLIAEPYVTTPTGSTQGNNDGPARLAQFTNPWGIAIDANNNLYIADRENHKIRKLDSNTGMISTVAGTGEADNSGDGGLATDAQLNFPLDVEVDKNDNLYILDTGNRSVRMVNAKNNIITTIAGHSKTGSSCDEVELAIDVGFLIIIDIALYENNGISYLYVVDFGAICRINLNNGTVKKIAGMGIENFDDLIQDHNDTCDTYPADIDDDCRPLATEVEIDQPSSMVIDSMGNLYFGDGSAHMIYKVDLEGRINIIGKTVDPEEGRYICDEGLPTEEILEYPTSLTLDNTDNIYTFDSTNNILCKFNNIDGTFSTIIRSSSSGYGNDFKSFKKIGSYDTIFSDITNIALDKTGNTLYFVDSKNHRIRKISGLLPSTDTQSPIVTITYPDQQILSNLLKIEGIVNEDNELGDIGIQIKYQTLTGEYSYLGVHSQFANIPEWLSPQQNNNNWSYDTSKVSFPEGDYTIKVRVFDKAGNFNEENINLTINKRLPSKLSLYTNSQTILQNKSLSIAGKLTQLPDDPNLVLTGETIEIAVTSPTGTVFKANAITDKLGNYNFDLNTMFTHKGQYNIQTKFTGNKQLLASNSSTQTVLVGSSAGYAILIQGSMTNNEGMEAYNKTLNRLYQRMLDRGFLSDNIYYFNNNDIQDEVDAIPSEAAIQQAITEIGGKINGSPAPLYIFMVDHGNPGIFYLGDEIIKASELNSWLSDMEAGLNTTALTEPRVVVIGACYSGSFIPELSKKGRTIITSSAADEVSYKGLKEKDGIRSGEFFIEEFSQHLWRGLSLQEAFTKATASTEMFTRSGVLAANTANQYLDDAMQHPLLDDDGNGKGSNVLTVDGQNAKSIFLGAGVSLAGNANNVKADIITVTPPQYLTADESTALLFLTANDVTKIDSAQIAIRPPSKVLYTQKTTGQIDIDLENQFLKYNDTPNRFEINYSGFTEVGMYEIFYTVRDSKTKQISLVKHSIIYKNKPGNSPPSEPILKAPHIDEETATILAFDWKPSVDPDGDLVHYNLFIAKDENFNNEVIAIRNLTTSMHFVNESVDLQDLTNYYWKVEAVDSFGAITESEVHIFKTNNTSRGYTAINLAVRSDLFAPVCGNNFQFWNNEGIIQQNIDIVVEENCGDNIIIFPNPEPATYRLRIQAPNHMIYNDNIQVNSRVAMGITNEKVWFDNDIQQEQIILNRDCYPNCDDHGSLQLAQANIKTTESANMLTTYVQRTSGCDNKIEVDYNLTSNSAEFGSDYSNDTGTKGTLVWDDGDCQTKFITIPISDDNNYEGNETFNINLSTPSGGAKLGEVSQTIVTIVDNEKPQAGTVEFTKNNYDDIEENGGNATITVTRQDGNFGDIYVEYIITSASTATSGSDFTNGEGTLFWSNGESGSKTISLSATDDNNYEGNETVIMRLINVTGDAELGNNSLAKFIITDDDIGEVVTENTQNNGSSLFINDNYKVNAADGTFMMKVARINGSDGNISTKIITKDATAIDGTDYIKNETVLSWNDGDNKEKYFTVQLLNNLEDVEKFFTITLLNPDTLDEIASTKVTIVPVHNIVIDTNDYIDKYPVSRDDEEKYSVSICKEIVKEIKHGTLQFAQTNYLVNEGDSKFTIDVGRINGGDGKVIVKIIPIVGEGMAMLGEDYHIENNATLMWEDGNVDTQKVTLLTIDDNKHEDDEIVVFGLSVVSGNVNLGNSNQALLTIEDNDFIEQPEQQCIQNNTFNFVQTNYNVKEGDGDIEIEVQRLPSVNSCSKYSCQGSIRVEYGAISGSTAVLNSDYNYYNLHSNERNALPWIMWQNGECGSKSIRLNIIDDEEFEGNEKLVLRLSNADGISVVEPNQAELVIIDNDERTNISKPICFVSNLGKGVVEPPEDFTVSENFDSEIAANNCSQQSVAFIDTEEEITIEGRFTVSPEFIGAEAEIVVFGTYMSVTEKSFMKLQAENLIWIDSIDHNLIKAMETVTLKAIQTVDIYTGLLPVGEFKFYFGYRLQSNGPIVYNGEQAIKIFVKE